jgi:nitrite reductase/ring-hydroxylating ferredoxin subunit
MMQNRREFIKKALCGLLGLYGIGSVVAGLKVLSPSGVRERELAWFPLLTEDDVPRRGVRKRELVYAVAGKERRGRVFVVASEDGLAVLSAVCSHLGCLVNYHKEKREFVCPCHAGRYDITGRNIGGPPPAPLSKLPHRVEKGVVLVGVKV